MTDSAYGGFGVSLALIAFVGLIASFWVWIAAAMGVWWERKAGPSAVARMEELSAEISGSHGARGVTGALGPLQVAEPARLLLGHGHGDRMLVEVGHRVAEVIQQQGGHVLADAQADQDALHGDVGD